MRSTTWKFGHFAILSKFPYTRHLWAATRDKLSSGVANNNFKAQTINYKFVFIFVVSRQQNLSWCKKFTSVHAQNQLVLIRFENVLLRLLKQEFQKSALIDLAVCSRINANLFPSIKHTVQHYDQKTVNFLFLFSIWNGPLSGMRVSI